MRNLIADLAAISGQSHVLAEPDDLAGYTTDWMRRYVGVARCVVRPGSTEEVAEVVKICARVGVPMVPQGGNTGLVGGSVPASGPPGEAPVIVSTARLTTLESVDQVAAEVTAGAGVTIARLHDHAATAGLRYGVDLASRGSATVGGTIATNAGGIHTIRYGPTRAQVVGLTAVLADGQVLDGVRGTASVSAGYDLAQLLTGSEGTLGIVTTARLRLRPAEPAVAVALAGVDGMQQAAQLCSQIRGEVPDLLAAEYFDAAGLGLVLTAADLPHPLPGTHAGYLLVEMTGPADADYDLERLARAGLPADTAVAVDRPGQSALWAYRERLAESIASAGVPHKVDVSVPVGELAAFRAELDGVIAAASGGADASVVVFGHIAVGNLHVNVLGPDPADTAVDAAVARLAASHGGSVAAEHGVGRAKTGWLHWSRSQAEISAMRAIKTALDPDGLLNPGVLVG
jgi:FAD/FMN-containing dehydrogenase